jgi:NADH:ubiquinone oxidoreductase subunit 3 (subunit A)
MSGYILIGIFALTGALFAGGAMIVSRLLAPRFPSARHKLEAYESGETPIGTARIQFKVGYYLFALVFLVFDVEAVFLFPVVTTLRGAQAAIQAGDHTGMTALFILGEVVVFIAILAFALYYALRKKALTWE